MRVPKSNKYYSAIVYIILIIAFLSSCAKEESSSSNVAELAGSDTEISKIAFGSCAFQWNEQPIWNTIAKTEPDLFLFIGDAIYGDWDGEKVYDVTDESLTREWGLLSANQNFNSFRNKIPVIATWDNHDYGKHNGGADFSKKELTKKHFLDFFNEPEDSERRKTAGIYDAKIFGPESRRVQIILLDTRYFKSPFIKDERSKEEKEALNIVGNYKPNLDPEATLLGEEQWKWLEDQLTKPAEIRFIVSSTQIIANEKGMDEWGNFPLERKKLFTLIQKTNANGVIFLSGNVHFAEISKTDEGPYPLYDITSSGLTHINENYAKAVNSYRINEPFVDLNFGIVEIDWDAQPSPLVKLKVIDLEGNSIIHYQISLSELSN
jgi:alkaline phosphatase D